MSQLKVHEVGDRLLQTYVLDKWFVSTVCCASSTSEAPHLRYWETAVWEIGPDRVMGKLLDRRAGSDGHHLDICRRLIQDLPLYDDYPDE